MVPFVQVAGQWLLTVQGWLRSHTGPSGICDGRSDTQQCSIVIYSLTLTLNLRRVRCCLFTIAETLLFL